MVLDFMPNSQESSTREPSEGDWSRRSFLVETTSLATTVSLAGYSFVTGTGTVEADPWLQNAGSDDSPIIPAAGSTRHWLGPELWGNRLQDWQFNDGRVECLQGEAGYELRTAAILTREVVTGNAPGHLRVRTGIGTGADEPGFCGFLIGVGNGELDHRAAALAQRSSGTGGGLLCTYESDGSVKFREHTDEANPVTYAELPVDEQTSADRPTADDEIRLAVDILPQDGDKFTVHTRALEAESGDILAEAVRRDIPERNLLGGVSLVSSPMPGENGPRWWFERLTTGGGKIERHPERTFGPIAGTLYSVDESVLKLSAQLLPIGDSDPKTVRLRYRPASNSETWQTEQTTLGPGYTARFRFEGWDSSRAWEYQVVYEDGTGQEWRYDGRIDADPEGTDELTLGLLSCIEVCARKLDETDTPSDYSQDSVPGRYTSANISFPCAILAENLRVHEPELLICVGDQVYENKPTLVDDRDDPELDYLYKWYMWLWSFRDLTRDTPTVVLIDDHDVYQPMLWGSGGEQTAMGNLFDGGYVGTAEFVNRVQRIQCGHNPDPYDSTSAERGISTYYGSFTYGGTNFAMLEDRKFKIGPGETEERKQREAELLGERQEQFLEEWATDRDDEAANVCLTQTCFASTLTIPGGKPATLDEAPKLSTEANGFPKGGRDRAIKHLREAGALVLAGDLHLPMLVRHGLDTHTDGVVQFVGPGGSAPFVRWFNPAESLPNGRGYPNTGNVTDDFGNKVRMLAVKNPDISHETLERDPSGNRLLDREKRPDGYGIVRVDYENEMFIIECWPWSVDPTTDDANQFTGWPYRLPFSETTLDSHD